MAGESPQDMTLADLRKRVGLTQRDVARLMAVSRTQVCRIESMYPDVMFQSVRKYMDALGVDIKFAIEGDEEWLSGDIVASANHDIVFWMRHTDPTRGPRITPPVEE
ncbi:helix-turn-helix domain-containing protein [Streptomyces cellulosae]